MRNILSVNVDENYFDVNVQLCKPNRTPIDNLNSIYNKKLHVKLGNIHEFSFSIPYYVSRNHQRIENPLLKKLKLGYLVYLEFKSYKEYFIVMDDSKSLSSSGDTINFKLKSLAYRLSKFDVRDIEVESYTLSQLMLGTPEINGILSETNWTLGHVDVDFDLLYRSYSVTTSTVLQCIFEIAEKFGAMPRFNTITRKVDFIELESSGIDRGFRAKEGINLESWGVDATIEEIVTRLKCYGQDGLEFRSLSPNGANHIQDFSYWMYPFETILCPNHNPNNCTECINGYKVLQSSDYMSDELCIALTKYHNLTQQLTGQFNNLVQQKTTKEDEKVQREKELSDLETELKNLNHELDLINLTYKEDAIYRQDWIDLQPQLNAKELQVRNKQNQIQQIDNEIDSIENQLLNLQRQLATENNFTTSEIDELKDYIYVKEFTDSSIVEEKDLLEAGVKEFAKHREPKVSVKFTIADFIKDMKFKADKGKINLGDIATFESKRLDIEIQTRITEIDYDLDNYDHTITISNDINRTTDEDLLSDLLSKVSTTALTLDAKLYTIDQAKHTGTMVDQMLNSAFDTGKQVLLGGFESTNEMTERGFYSRSIHNPTMDFLVMNGGAIYWSNDGARSVSVAIDSSGVYADKLIGRLILSNKMMIESNSGIITIEDEAMTIKDSSMKTLVQVGRYPDPSNPSNMKHGLFVNDGAIDIRTSSSPNRGMQMDAEGLRAFNNNGVKVFEVDSTFGDLFFMGKIESSTMNASTITGSTITGSILQTTDVHNRGIKIDSNGLSLYDTNGERTAFLNALTGDVDFKGDISGSTITGSTIQTTDVNNRGLKINQDGLSLYNTNGIRNVFLDASNGDAEFRGNINGSSFIGGDLDIGNGAFKVDSDGTATMTKANIQTSPTNNLYIKMEGSIIRGGNLDYGNSYMLGTATISTMGDTYRSGLLQLDDYNSELGTNANRTMQLTSNTIMVKGSNLVLGGASQNNPVIISRKVESSHHGMEVGVGVALHVDGGLEVSGTITSRGEELATIAYVQSLISSL